MMENYTAKDGLNVLNYLGITNLTNQEKTTFKEKWDEVYQSHKQDLIGTIVVLYTEALPFICGDGDRGSFALAQIRDSDFFDRIKITGLEEELKQGIILKDIVKKGPHQFLKTFKL